MYHIEEQKQSIIAHSSLSVKNAQISTLSSQQNLFSRPAAPPDLASTAQRPSPSLIPNVPFPISCVPSILFILVQLEPKERHDSDPDDTPEHIAQLFPEPIPALVKVRRRVVFEKSDGGLRKELARRTSTLRKGEKEIHPENL
jgi:hypothetical protein